MLNPKYKNTFLEGLVFVYFKRIFRKRQEVKILWKSAL